MSKVITFSREFPKYHPKAGQPTFFVEQIYNSLLSKNNLMDYSSGVKKHTIRKGNRWKVGDKFSPRVWSGKPYKSKQFILCEDIEIKKIYQIRIWRESLLIWRFYINGEIISDPKITELAKNDGLSYRDLLDWFNVPVEKNFEGQIICWSDAYLFI